VVLSVSPPTTRWQARTHWKMFAGMFHSYWPEDWLRIQVVFILDDAINPESQTR